MEAILFLAVVLPIGLALGRAAQRRGDRMVAHWAAENRLKLIKVKHCRSPFKCFYGPGGTSNVQSLFRVSVQDETGRIVEGWLRCGDWSIGLFSDKVEFYPEAENDAPVDDWPARIDA